MKRRFGLLGASGYIAPRHFKAIKNTGNELVAAMDPFDSVGIIDSYFPNADFFTEIERFDRHLDKLGKANSGIDYLSVCSPNYLHDSHIRFGLRQNADVICEKPLVLNPWNIELLAESEAQYQKRVYNILQLRLHPSVQALKSRIETLKDSKVDIDLTYITSRGHWYYTSWKGAENKSGGIATNIGIHFFDMLIWIFGEVQESKVHLSAHDRASGYLELEKARVRWFLSINPDCLPERIKKEGKTTYRSLMLGDEEFEFSGGFADLHDKSYREILDGNGFGLQESFKSIQLVHSIRNSKIYPLEEDYHPLAKLPLAPHPFKRGLNSN